MINFSSRSTLASALFVKWTVSGLPTAYLSDYVVPITFGGNAYTNIGNLLKITPTTNDLRATASEMGITLSGLVSSSVSQVLNSPIKGSEIEIYRGFFDPATNTLLNLSPNANPSLKFKGIVTNYSVNETFESETRSMSTDITLTCNSEIEVLSNKVNGRRTNPRDFPQDKSMDRVSALANSNYQFGAPQ
jgi:hypothetical protein